MSAEKNLKLANAMSEMFHDKQAVSAKMMASELLYDYFKIN